MPEQPAGARLSIAVDGPASSGKGTVARAVARTLGYAYVDTGAIYRTVAWFAVRQGLDLNDGLALAGLADRLQIGFSWDGDVLRVSAHDPTEDVEPIDVSGVIRTASLGGQASQVSRHPAVRAALLELQRAYGREGAVVMDGRDIGTVVLPDAELKVFLDADLQERARRRHEELVRRGETPSFDAVRDALAARDDADANRATAPLKAADDAVHIDSTDVSIPAVVARVVALAEARGAVRPA